jgi:uncharacterized repeat protein (TIGR01451 family)
VESSAGSSVTWTATTSGSFGLTVAPASFDLAPGASQVITVTANVAGEPTATWLFGEVQLTPDDAAVSTAHFPVAVIANTGDIPNTMELDVRRDAGSDLVRDVTVIEITDLTVESFGLVQGTQHAFQLAQDPTVGDAYDDLNDVWWTTVTVPAGAKRLVGELVASTAVDLDLYVGTGSTPSAVTQQCASTSASYVEYCNVDDPAAGTWWVLVQNWDGSAALDDVTAVIAVVGSSDAGNLTVSGPAAVPELDPFDLRVFWDEPALDAGEYWYGGFTLGADAGNPGNIGTVRVNLQRLEDDVTKTADTTAADPGDTVNYTITVLPNTLSEDVTYWLTDTIPAGMSYVPGSAVASAGTVNVTGDTLTWSGTQDTDFGDSGNYVMTTNGSDASCDTGFGGYVNLQASGILAQSALVGDSTAFIAFTTGDPINIFGVDYAGMGFTDDGFAIADPITNYGGSPWIPQAIPDATAPDNVLAAYWHDFELFYNAGANQGVSLATAGAPGGVLIIEYDDIEPFGGGAAVMDFEIVMTRAVDNAPGAYEVAFAYDNVTSTPGTATIGVENQTGTAGVALVNDGSPTGVVADGLVVCFDYQGPQFDPVTISYAVTVDAGASGTLTNDADSTTSTPGSALATTSADVALDDTVLYLPIMPFEG